MDTAGFILIPRYFCFCSMRRPVRKAACHAYGLFGAFHIGLRKFVRCRSEAQNLCTSLNGRCPSGVRLWSTLDFCRTVWELMSPKIKDRHGKYTVQAVGAFYIFRAFTISSTVDGDIYSH